MDTTTAEAPPASLPHTLKQEPALHIPLPLLAPSPTNPRRKFDAAKLQELADGIRELGGNFTPILARPNPAHTEGDGQPRYEIVAGERRWRACALAGLETVLALVRPLTDRQALQIQLKENLDRESLHELEEAEGIQRLIDDTGDTAEQIAATLGKGRRWLFGRLALLKLTPPVREMFLADAFKATVAGLIARIPNPDQQLQAAQHIALGWGGEPYSFRAAADWLAKEYMLALAKAPFDTALTYPVAGPCSACPKRSGAAPDLFEDVKGGDMCQDSKCYQLKAAQHIDHQLAEARAAGHQVLEREAARKLMPSSSVLPFGHHWLDKPCPLSTSDKPLRELFGAKARDVITLHHPSGAIVSIVPEASVRKLLKSKGLLKVEPPVQKNKPTPTQDQQADDAPAAAAPTSDAAPAKPAPVPLSKAQLQMNITARRSELFGQLVLKALHEQLAAVDELPLIVLRLAITELLENSSYEAIAAVYKALNVQLPESAFDDRAGHLLSYLDIVLKSLDGRRLGEALALCLVAEELTDTGIDADELSDRHDGMVMPLADHFRLDLGFIEVEATDCARIQVFNEEATRLGIDPATLDDPDATQAWVRSQLADPAAPRGIKYRNHATGETWSGKGLQPKWLKAAIAAGATLNDFEVTPA